VLAGRVLATRWLGISLDIRLTARSKVLVVEDQQDLQTLYYSASLVASE